MPKGKTTVMEPVLQSLDEDLVSISCESPKPILNNRFISGRALVSGKLKYPSNLPCAKKEYYDKSFGDLSNREFYLFCF